MTTMRFALATLVLAGAATALVPAQASAQRRQRDLITREEIVASPQKDMDAFQLIRSLRPRFLEAPPGVRSFGGTTSTLVAVYVDRVRQSGPDALKTIMSNTIDEIRYMEPSRATNEFGPMDAGGAIVIKSYKAPKVTKDAIKADTTPPSDSTRRP